MGVSLAGPAGMSTAGAWILGFATTRGTGGLAAIGAAIVAAISYKLWSDDYESEMEKNRKAVKDKNDKFFVDMASDIDTKNLPAKLAKIQQERAAAEADAAKHAGDVGSDHEKNQAERQARLDKLKELEGNTTNQIKEINDAEAKKRLENTQGTKEWIAKNSEQALKDLGPVTIENATERFKQIEQLSKKVMAPDFKIQEKIDAIREKLTGIKWFIMDESQQTEMNTALARLQTVQQVMANIADIGGTTKVAADRLASVGDSFGPKSAAMKAIGVDGNISKAIIAMKDIFSGDKGINVEQVKTASIGLNSAKKMFEDASGMGSSMTEFVNSTGKYTESIVTTAVSKVTNTVTKMVSAVQTMDDALSKLGTINIGTRLDSVAKSLGIGSSGTYTVQSKEVVINVNFTIQMDAGKVEKAILMNTESIIKDRINFALGGGQGKNEVVAESLKPNMTYTPVATNVK
jgi:hypothetical protein